MQTPMVADFQYGYDAHNRVNREFRSLDSKGDAYWYDGLGRLTKTTKGSVDPVAELASGGTRRDGQHGARVPPFVCDGRRHAPFAGGDDADDRGGGDDELHDARDAARRKNSPHPSEHNLLRIADHQRPHRRQHTLHRQR